MEIQVKVLDPRVLDHGLPEVQTLGSAGMDLRVFWPAVLRVEAMELQPGDQVLMDTGISVWIRDPNYAGFMFARSGTGVKGLVLGNGTGVIDSDYQGPLKVCLWNRSKSPILITNGDRVAQMVVMRVASGYTLRQVEEFDGETGRGVGGFGSTGVR